MIMKKIAYLFVLALLVGCGQAENGLSDAELISLPSGIEVLDMSGVVKSVSFMQPEITDESLITSTLKTYRIDGKVYIGSDNAILVFGEDGSFTHRIEHQGNGPGEYVRLTDFDISEETKTIYLLDNNAQRILLYSLDGDFVKSIDIDFWAIKIKVIEKSIVALFSGNQTSGSANEHKINLIDTESGDLQSKSLPIDPQKAEYLHMLSANNWSSAGGETLFAELYNDTIYRIDREKCTPAYITDFGSDRIPESFFQNGFEDVMQFSMKFQENSFSYGYNTILNLGKSFLCSIYLKKTLQYYYHGTGKSIVFDDFLLKDLFGDFKINVKESKVRFA